MIKVRILDRCNFCKGEAYLFVCEECRVRVFPLMHRRPNIAGA